ncbi:MAG: FAD-binding oxidoreductase [Kangiellaceae bacterium]|nr:FAD-binding oxidoreductase [Kangiellaceae bacterium]MCW9000524.1 FAD-binding oxidoreductase [Kangiellaceae bacterium]
MNQIVQDYPQSYYAATMNDDCCYPQLEGEIEAETCIIGGGYAGLMTAMGLVERGYTDIAIVEQNRIGWGASGRNGGFVFGGYSLSPQKLVSRVGEEKARALYHLTVSAVELIRTRAQQYAIDCDLVDEGVILANWFKDQSLLQNQAQFMLDKMKVNWRYLSPRQLSSLINSDRYCGGLYEPNAMHFHPLNYARGIAAQINNTQARIFESSKVVSVEAEQPVKSVFTQKGRIRCKNLVVAGGGYINNLIPKISNSVLPIATYVMATEPLGERLAGLIKTKAAVYDTRFAFDYYRPLQDTRILWGGRVSARRATPANLAQLLKKDLSKVFPSLGDVKIDYVWDGWMSYASHQMAQIGQTTPGVWYAIGFGGHGVAPTTTAGEVLAEAIAGGNESYQQFSPWGLPWNGSVFGPMAAQTSYWWYQLKDWLKDRLEK